MRTPPQNPRRGNFPAAAKGGKGLLKRVVLVFKLVVVFKAVVLFEIIIGRKDETTDPLGNERECIFVVLSYVSSVDCVARALKHGEGK